MEMQAQAMPSTPRREPWNKGKLIGQKPPLRPNMYGRSVPDCRWRDRRETWQCSIWQSTASCGAAMSSHFGSRTLRRGYAVDRATVRQKKTGRPVRFELTEQTRQAVDDYIKAAGKKPGEFLFSGRGDQNRSMTTRQYARLASSWLATIGLDPHFFATHSLRRTKATLIYRRTGNLRAVPAAVGTYEDREHCQVSRY
jgi:integrase